MATNASEENKVIYLSINQGEQAKHQSAEYLLAAPVFEEIARLLEESLKNLENARDDDDLDDLRAHETILLDGGCGTGKTTILVNLSLYMESVDALRDRLLILKPVDPTLLENDDDLFLNIIVAAILRDKTVKTYLDVNHKDNQKPNPAKIEKFYKQLQSLGHALEGTQKQKSEFGIEKLRAFVGNHSVAEEVHKLFAAVLDLTGKEMIVLPIDDVDTSLENAFKNLEVVRRYLASPYIVPIISGDQELFHEVIWRNFYHGLTANCNELKDDAIERAKRLAIEYERKLIPVARKLRTPDLDTYFSGDTYMLKDQEDVISFREYRNWLSFLHNFHLNGFENSRIDVDILSLRAFVQLVKATRTQLLALNQYLGKCCDSVDLKGFYLLSLSNNWKSSEFRNLVVNSVSQLAEVYKNGRYGSELEMVYEANRFWLKDAEKRSNAPINDPVSIFDTPLFQPLWQENQRFLVGEDGAVLKESWRKHLLDRVDDQVWLENLPEKTVISFPPPDKGLVFSHIRFEENELSNTVCKLLVQDQIYAKDKNSALVFLGRIFELLSLSTLPEVKHGDLLKIFNRNPYYSVISFSGTKPIALGDASEVIALGRNIVVGGGNLASNFHQFTSFSDAKELVKRIFEWRDFYLNKIDAQQNALLIYRVMNKFFTQLSISYNELSASGIKGAMRRGGEVDNKIDTKGLARIGIRAFNAYCAAIGSFEREVTQGVLNENAFTVNDHFEQSDLFKENIAYFLERVDDHWEVKENVKGWTGALYLHPLRSFFEACLSPAIESGQPSV